MLIKRKIFKIKPDDRRDRETPPSLINYSLEVRRVGKLCRVTDNKMLKVFTGAIYKYK